MSNETTQQIKTKNLVEQILTTEVKFFISLITAVVVIVWGVAIPYFGIRQDIAIIKENHMAHMEAFSKEQTRLSEVQTKQGEMLIGLMTKVAELKQ